MRSNDAMEPLEYRGHTIRVMYDEDPANPRKDFDHMGKMVCWHHDYDLGDEMPKHSPSDWRLYLMEEHLTEHGRTFDEDSLTPDNVSAYLDKHFLILPLYLYDHSGITMSTSRFSCPWDSGQVGWIYVSVEQAREEFTGDDWRELALKLLEAEVEEYDQYLTGQVYGFDIEGPVCDASCWGFFGELGYCLGEAKASVDYAVERHVKEVLGDPAVCPVAAVV